MTKEQLDFLTTLKRDAIRYLVAYSFVSLGAVIGFYIDTKIKIGELKSEQQALKEAQAQTCHQVTKLYELHMGR